MKKSKKAFDNDKKMKNLFYRKKFLLAFLEAFGGSLDSLKFQKYLFLIIKQLDKKYYSFIPYKYGCFSFESYHDKRSLIKSGYLIESSDKWILKGNNKFISKIYLEEKESIFSIKQKYGNLSRKSLLKHLYLKHPYYAINSQIIQKADLSFKEKREIINNKPIQKDLCLFTVGYEGRSIDQYLNLLIKNNIKILCDVRKNPLSRKYGFSKKSLQDKTKKLNIEYLHIPELGINSYLRKNLSSKQDYTKLFTLYKKEILLKKEKELNKIIDKLQKKKRIALTCFELDPHFCHRFCVSSKLKKINPKLKIEHL